jgi:hypothetical protein
MQQFDNAKPTGCGVLARRIRRRDRMAHRQQGQLQTPTIEEGIAGNK